jgi:hypothetical protein
MKHVWGVLALWLTFCMACGWCHEQTVKGVVEGFCWGVGILFFVLYMGLM